VCLRLFQVALEGLGGGESGDLQQQAQRQSRVDLGDDPAGVQPRRGWTWCARVVAEESLQFMGRVSVEREFEAQIIEQHIDERVAWNSTGGQVDYGGVVTFHKLAENETRVTV